MSARCSAIGQTVQLNAVPGEGTFRALNVPRSVPGPWLCRPMPSSFMWPVTVTLLTASDVAKILRVPRAFVYTLARRGELPTVRVGDRYVRFRDDALRRWIEECETTGPRGTP